MNGNGAVAKPAALRQKYCSPVTVAGDLSSIEKSFPKKVRAAIEQDLVNDRLSTDLPGQKIGLSRTQLHRKVPDRVNPGESIRSIRMQRAMTCCSNVCPRWPKRQVGYTSPANFSMIFFKYFGYPPGAAPE
ncbi:helix-turn-helix domain-containing protein [Niabella aurantiaca]|uniref:helix-turn-helix domain-containing protein n=1 Tax=Niabella aurantiaca TaxID=379900 RepID=UPI000362ACFD|nr:AraC family transcriptional regulator [Niabella aurantiaca]